MPAKKTNPLDGLTVGRNVHFIAENGDHCLAFITWVWHENGTVNLLVANPMNGNHGEKNTIIETSVTFDEAGTEPGTWHWIEPA